MEDDMQHRIGTAALAAAMLALMTVGMATAGEQETVGGVTILRGMSPTEQSAANPTNTAPPGSSAPELVGSYSVDVNGRLKQLSIGSSNPGAVVIPAPEAGR